MKICDFDVEIVKKDIKNLHLSVLPPNGKIKVSAPLFMTDESIKLFIIANQEWILNKQKEFFEQERQSKRQYVSGETVYVWGRPYYLKLEYNNKQNSFKLEGNKAILTVRKNSTVQQREKYLKEWYRNELKSEVEVLLPKIENRIGIKCNSWQIKYMITKWGSCNQVNKKIWLNLQLAKKPIECLEYVIIHELIHTIIPNHNKDFIAMIDNFMPNWHEVKEKLNALILDYMDK